MRRLPLLLLALAVLAGCATRPAPPADLSPLDRELAAVYERLGAEEFAEADFGDAIRFRRKARAALAGDTPPPDALEDRRLPPDVAEEAAAGRERLAAVLRTTAPLTAPETVAAAQGAFDCWLQEAEEGLQPDEIAACRDRFFDRLAAAERAGEAAVVILLPSDGEDAAIAVDAGGQETVIDRPFAGVAAGAEGPGDVADLDEGAVRAALARTLAAEPQAQRSYLVYFGTGGSDITEESRAAFDAAVADALGTEAARVTVFGHTDRVGSQAVNVRLARARARSIADDLIAAGVPEEILTVDSFGESFPVVPTDDGVPEPLNRRVEIAVR